MPYRPTPCILNDELDKRMFARELGASIRPGCACQLPLLERAARSDTRPLRRDRQHPASYVSTHIWQLRLVGGTFNTAQWGHRGAAARDRDVSGEGDAAADGSDCASVPREAELAGWLRSLAQPRRAEDGSADVVDLIAISLLHVRIARVRHMVPRPVRCMASCSVAYALRGAAFG